MEVNDSNRPSEQEIELALAAISGKFENCSVILRAALIAIDNDLKNAVSAFDELHNDMSIINDSLWSKLDKQKKEVWKRNERHRSP